mgnify:CR=1 FL=1|tara:strand:- start:3007 stop:4218 length:1212 start_codon:yes stop_codon:yes gene_type:complete
MLKVEEKPSFDLRTVLVFLSLTLGFNFVPLFSMGSLPLFHVAIFLLSVIGLLRKRFLMPNSKVIIFYSVYVLSSFWTLIFYADLDSYKVLFYSIIPILILSGYRDLLSRRAFDFFLKYLSFSIFLIVSIGWLIRLDQIDANFLFEGVLNSQIQMGYWGIRYLESTRNADYLYPLLGLVISLYWINSKKFNFIYFVLAGFFIFTLIASLSRGAFIITLLAVLILTIKVQLNRLLFFIFILLLYIFINFNAVNEFLSVTYIEVIRSISLDSVDSKYSNFDRYHLIMDSISASIVNPLGLGIGNFNSMYADISSISNEQQNSAENAFLTILIERGWFAFIAFVLMWIYLFRNSLRNKSSFNVFAIPLFLVYFLVNYELDNIFGNMIICLIIFDEYIHNPKLHTSLS